MGRLIMLGAGGAGETRVIYDTFTGSGALTAHTPEVAPAGSSWAIRRGTFANLSGGKLGYVSTDYFSAVINAGITDLVITADVTTPAAGNSGSGVVFRSNAAATNRYCLDIVAGNEIRLFKWTDLAVGDWSKQYANATLFAELTNVTLKILCSDGVVRCGTPGTWGFDYTDTSYTANTYVGVGGFNGANTNLWDTLTVSPVPNQATWTKLGYMGDSVSTPYTWAGNVAWQYHDGQCKPYNYAVAGNTIVDHMAGQATSILAAGVDYVMIELGTNDIQNLATMQAAYISGLQQLLASYTTSQIFCMSPLPRVGNVDPDWDNCIAVENACTATGVTFWDTRTDPWIDIDTDLTDAVHPNAAGHAKITTRALALLPA